MSPVNLPGLFCVISQWTEETVTERERERRIQEKQTQVDIHIKQKHKSLPTPAERTTGTFPTIAQNYGAHHLYAIK